MYNDEYISWRNLCLVWKKKTLNFGFPTFKKVHELKISYDWPFKLFDFFLCIWYMITSL